MGVPVTERQLHLFRSRKRRGEMPPSASEYQLHCAVVSTIRRWMMPGWIFTHIASGERRDILAATRLKKMGVVPGFSDLVFYGPNGEVGFVEFKAEGGQLSEAQAAVKRHLRAAGHGYLCSSDYREVVETLKAWGVVKACVSVQ